MDEKEFVVKISMDLVVKTTTEVSARRVAMSKVVLPLRNSPIGRGFDVESITIKE